LKKVIKSAKVCEHCGSVLEYESYAYFCDYCKNKFSDKISIHITIFWKQDTDLRNTNHQEFCSMNCARQWLLKFPYNLEQVDFMTLPYINGSNLKEFLEGK